MDYLIVFTIAFGVAIAITPLARWISFRFGIVAVPGGRRKHAGKIPKLGGLPLLVALLVGWAAVYWLLPPTSDSTDKLLLPGVMLGTTIVSLGGLLDDRWDLPPWAQFGIHFVGVIVAMRYEVFIERFTHPFPSSFLLENPVVIESNLLIFVLTAFWITGMINTVNWLDGLDGLASGVGAIAAALFAWHSFSLIGQPTAAAFSLVLAGALLGFLMFNFAPARIFLGSAGAYLLGFQLATLAIITPAKIATALLVLAVPIIDVAWRIIDRLRQGRSPFTGDRGHLHHLLYDRGLPTRLIVVGYYMVTVAFGVAAILMPTPAGKYITLLLLATAVLTLLLWLSATAPKQTKE
ncbi:MAG: undecaprenyl/decaprenyl-phosphate alpha-N-acetylglucosaminyl 1-phosphate transferase [Chloroflexi bacterium]|nr:undecaprenyl/decaprenyl-phosphate alpha-N-acetylglucosaminyl 1-phosphate transferase [Chloroflexota bacterium]